MLTALSAIVAKQAAPTQQTLKNTKQLLNFATTQGKIIMSYKASDIILTMHSSASYQTAIKAQSQAGRPFFLSNNEKIPHNNGVIHNIAKAIKAVMSVH